MSVSIACPVVERIHQRPAVRKLRVPILAEWIFKYILNLYCENRDSVKKSTPENHLWLRAPRISYANIGNVHLDVIKDHSSFCDITVASTAEEYMFLAFVFKLCPQTVIENVS